MSSSIELIFVPAAGSGHLASAVEMAKLLIATDSHLSATVLLIKFPFDSDINTTTAASERIKFVDLPRIDPPDEATPFTFFLKFHESHKSNVRDAVRKISSDVSVRVAGFVLDMFCTPMMDVADELGVPSYVFFTSGAGFLCVMTYIESHDSDEEIKDEIIVPGFAHLVPEKVLPFALRDKASSSLFNSLTRRIARSNGVLINTFEELEPSAIQALSSFDHAQFPPVYPVGPLMNLSRGDSRGEIMEWLDGQPASSVVFLCFGSMGSFGGDQVREIAIALESTGVRFLWSLRRPRHEEAPTDYENPSEVLPEGFLERTAGIGKVVGWAPQVAVLGHVAIGGFVSHCGWNSVLESVWFGVPVGTWPLYSEQHLNAFEMVRELGLGVEITLDSRRENVAGIAGDSTANAEEIARGIEKLIDSGIRTRVKEMSEKSRKALLHGGSSYNSLSRFINDVMDSTA